MKRLIARVPGAVFTLRFVKRWISESIHFMKLGLRALKERHLYAGVFLTLTAPALAVIAMRPTRQTTQKQFSRIHYTLH